MKKSANENGLHQAMQQVLQTQSQMQQTTALLMKSQMETNARNEERFARIDKTLDEHTRILNYLVHLIEALPEAVREKIGYKGGSK